VIIGPILLGSSLISKVIEVQLIPIPADEIGTRKLDTKILQFRGVGLEVSCKQMPAVPALGCVTVLSAAGMYFSHATLATLATPGTSGMFG
jgi:hypothetical protein